MFNYISNKIVDFLINNNEIRSDDKEMYLYCVSTSLEMLFNIFITLLIGVMWGRFFKSILFLCMIIPLRSICGGYHAERSGSCFFLSILIYLQSVKLSDVILLTPKISLMVFVLLSLIVGIMTPVDSIHKVLKKEEKIKQRKSYIVLISVIALILLSLIYLKKQDLYSLIIVIMFFTLLIQAAGIIKNKFFTI